ncbi:ergothioneine biosynthesis protein EgtC [Amycolatopsis acidiphila]|uniref:Gamma-glutamyl-hercynylcysteine sulfoxide hydrolase n=1 Tax=Amycolatopsis acidiphila TaxID=715473 RepID=A0A557ZRE1_9PSEU|nr:ergothioneine biosynthesis protein EgtC [Amycolatopsis acidiphila]TVT14597.1 ergothioneine biosynthesis protein EgtC [Amycolatopsis acidiphila]UIJ62835.1 ergothioneine biosynthesis protein EgtC [Amycolatopsis acidiphila]GHG64511.1 gamma-glutamyl-hercynylcysteine sulfoxide hydrolase [Amycolatopsis acidiphila]
MCRHLAYLGPPAAPAELVFGAPHSLLHQSYAPADMRGGGTVNADGFGLAWYTDGAPVRYRRASPVWTDHDAPVLAGSVRSGAFVAAVRNGTVGMPVTETAVAPFVDGPWSFSHNGMVTGWPGSLATLAGKLPVTDLLTLEAPTDSAVLWALLLERLRAGEDPLGAVAGLIAEVESAAPGSRLNFLLTDGQTLVATAWTHALSVRQGEGAVVVASEPTDPAPGWVPVPEGHAVLARHGGAELVPLDADRSALS